MPTGDHDLEYRHFEGVIPQGKPGGGPVMIWDEGTFNPEVEISRGVRREVTNPGEGEEVSAEGLRSGELKFKLYGKKLSGSFALVRTGGIGGKEAWLLIKHKDEESKEGHDAKEFDFSAVSGLSLAEIGSRGEIRRR